MGNHRSAKIHYPSHVFVRVLKAPLILIAGASCRSFCACMSGCFCHNIRVKKSLALLRVVMILGARAHVVRIWFCERKKTLVSYV